MGRPGNAHQCGGNLPAFHGVRVQRGYGLGALLKGLFRAAVPLLKQGAKTVGRTALKTGAQVASDVLQGQNIKSSLKTRGSQARQNLQNKAKQKVSKMIGGGKKTNTRQTKTLTKKKNNQSATKRMKGAVLKKRASFPKTTKGLTSLATREGYIKL